MKLLLLFLALSLVILVRVAVEENGYTTPDSSHYAGAGQALADTGQLVHINGGKTIVFTIWPLGYPLSIATVAKLTGISAFWSAKLVNLAWIGFSFLLIRKLFPKQAFWVALVFCMHSLLDIFSFTWSEGGFTVIMLWFAVALHHFLYRPEQRVEWAFQLLFAILSAFLYRYFGGFLLGVLSLFGVYFLLKRNWKEVGLLLGIAAGVLGFVTCYVWFVKQHSGYYGGTTRFYADEPFLLLLKNLLLTQVNEFAVIRHFNPLVLDYASWALFGFQLVVLGFVLWRVYQVPQVKGLLAPTLQDSVALIIGLVGLSYWLTMVIMRFLMKFDMFDFRLISPSTLLFLLALHGYLAAEKRAPILQRIQGPITMLYLLALAHGLYKKTLLQQVLSYF